MATVRSLLQLSSTDDICNTVQHPKLLSIHDCVRAAIIIIIIIIQKL